MAIKDSVDREEVQVWPIRLIGSASLVRSFRTVLSPEESARAARIPFDDLRARYVLSHGALHMLLARELGVAPAEIRFRYGSRGRPSISPHSSVEFNMSHSRDVAMFALTRKCNVGIDVERIRPVQDLTGIANRFFARAELSELMSVAPEQREKTFFTSWTRKEAYVKAVGEGLRMPLNSFCVTVSRNIDGWNVQTLEFDSDYSAALAYSGRPRMIRVFRPVSVADLPDAVA